MNKDLTVGSPSKVLWRFCLPMFGSILFQQLYNIADSLVAGKLIGENALAAVGNSYEITPIFLAFSFGCNIGGSVIVSRYFGAKDYNTMKTAVTTALIGTVVLCGALMAVGLLGCRSLLVLIRTPAELMADSAEYLDIYTLGLPFLFLYNVATGIFTALGDSRTPFLFLAVSSTANIAVDVLFVAAFDMGVAGVAWATFLCQGVSCVLSCGWWPGGCVLSRVRGAGLVLLEDAGPDRSGGHPQHFAAELCLSGQYHHPERGQLLRCQRDRGLCRGHQAEQCAHLLLTTLGSGISNYASQNLGAGKNKRVRAGFGAGVKLLGSICLCFTALYLLAGRQLLMLFMNSPTGEAINTGLTFLQTIAPFYLLLAFKLTSDGLMRGCGMMGRFMATTLSDLFLRVVLAILFSSWLGVNGIWLSWPVGWFVGTVLSMVFYRTSIHRQAEEKTTL